MNFKTTIVLIAVLALVAGVAMYVHSTHKDVKPETPAQVDAAKANAGKLLFDIKPADVATLDIQPSDSAEFALAKSGTTWRLTKPVNAPALSFEVEGLLTQILGLRSLGQVEPDQAVGLNPARYTVTITTSAGKTVKFTLGDRTALGDVMYVQVDGSGKPDVVSAQSYDAIRKPVNDLRDKNLVHLTPDKIQQVSLKRSDGPRIELQKKDGHWQETSPQSFQADPDAMDRLLSSITSLQASAFVNSGSVPPSSTRLDEPQVLLTLSSGTPTTAPTTGPTTAPSDQITLRIGQYDNIRKENVYASASDSTEVVKIGASHLDDFKQKPIEFRDKTLVDINPELVSSFKIVSIHKATTEPTSQPARPNEVVIERRKQAPPVLGPALPVGVALPATRPAIASTQTGEVNTTQPTVTSATTGPALTQPSAVATTQPTTFPAIEGIATQPSTGATEPAVSIATTGPATTQTTEVIPKTPASTQPAGPPSPWFFASGGEGDAEEGQVKALLDSFHSLRVEKYLEGDAPQGTLHTLVIHTVASKAADIGQDYVFNFTDLGTRVVGVYKDLTFEVDKGLIEKLTGDFKTKKPPAPPSSPPMSFPGGRMPFGGG